MLVLPDQQLKKAKILLFEARFMSRMIELYQNTFFARENVKTKLLFWKDDISWVTRSLASS
jgi:DNA modification methylase